MILKFKENGIWEFRSLQEFCTKRIVGLQEKLKGIEIKVGGVYIDGVPLGAKEFKKLKDDKYNEVSIIYTGLNTFLFEEAYLISDINGNTIANLSPKFAYNNKNSNEDIQIGNQYKLSINHWVDCFDYSIKNNKSNIIALPYDVERVVKDMKDCVDMCHRASGKTNALLEIYRKYKDKCIFITKKNNVLINSSSTKRESDETRICGNLKDKLKDDFNDTSTKLLYMSTSLINLSQYRDRKILLVEELEGFTKNELEELTKDHIVIGFVKQRVECVRD